MSRLAMTLKEKDWQEVELETQHTKAIGELSYDEQIPALCRGLPSMRYPPHLKDDDHLQPYSSLSH